MMVVAASRLEWARLLRHLPRRPSCRLDLTPRHEFGSSENWKLELRPYMTLYSGILRIRNSAKGPHTGHLVHRSSQVCHDEMHSAGAADRLRPWHLQPEARAFGHLALGV